MHVCSALSSMMMKEHLVCRLWLCLSGCCKERTCVCGYTLLTLRRVLFVDGGCAFADCSRFTQRAWSPNASYLIMGGICSNSPELWGCARNRFQRTLKPPEMPGIYSWSKALLACVLKLDKALFPRVLGLHKALFPRVLGLARLSFHVFWGVQETSFHVFWRFQEAVFPRVRGLEKALFPRSFSRLTRPGVLFPGVLGGDASHNSSWEEESRNFVNVGRTCSFRAHSSY